MEWLAIVAVVIAFEAVNVAVIYQKHKLVQALKELLDAQDDQIKSQKHLIDTLKTSNSIYRTLLAHPVKKEEQEEEQLPDNVIDVDFKVLK